MIQETNINYVRIQSLRINVIILSNTDNDSNKSKYIEMYATKHMYLGLNIKGHLKLTGNNHDENTQKDESILKHMTQYLGTVRSNPLRSCQLDHAQDSTARSKLHDCAPRRSGKHWVSKEQPGKNLVTSLLQSTNDD